MALKDLVRYVSRCCAQKPNCRNLYESAAKYDWDAADVMGFLRSERLPPKKMMKQMLSELDITPGVCGRAAEEGLNWQGQNKRAALAGTGPRRLSFGVPETIQCAFYAYDAKNGPLDWEEAAQCVCQVIVTPM